MNNVLFKGTNTIQCIPGPLLLSVLTINAFLLRIRNLSKLSTDADCILLRSMSLLFINPPFIKR